MRACPLAAGLTRRPANGEGQDHGHVTESRLEAVECFGESHHLRDAGDEHAPAYLTSPARSSRPDSL